MNSYILNNRKEKLVNFVLTEMNNSTYIRCVSLRRRFINDFRLDEDLAKSISIKIGLIAKELIALGILERDNKRYKNLFKGSLFEMLDKKMNENYTIIRFKAEI